MPVCGRCDWDPRRPLPPKTNLKPAKPFLLSSKTGKPVHKNLQLIDLIYFYHATNYKNLQGIKQKGMDPTRGGKGGAGKQVGSKTFIAHSKNFVHATPSTKTSSFYGLLHDEPTLFVKAYGGKAFKGGVPPDPQEFGSFTVILRFPRKIPNVTWVEDPDDKRDAWRTANKIPPQQIEALTTDGWVKISTLISLNEALGH